MEMADQQNSSFLCQSYHPRWQLQCSALKNRRKQITKHKAKNTDGPVRSVIQAIPVICSQSWWGNWLLLPLVILLYLPCEVWGTTFKIAIVGPWACDPMYSKALPDLAARLATSRINKDPELNKGYWYDYVLINEDCTSSRGLARFVELEGYGSAVLGPANPSYCTSAALLAKNWNKGILSWACLKADMGEGMYPTFLRPLPLSSRVLFSVLRFFRWAHVGIITTESDIWEATGHELASSLRALGLPVGTVVTMEMDKDGPRRALKAIREADRVRIVIMCMHSVLIGGEEQYQLLTTAMEMRMIDRGYIFIPYDTLLYSLPYKDINYPILANDTKLRRAYDGVLTITMDQGEQNFYEAFNEAQVSYDIRSSTPAEQVSPFFGTIYNMIYYTAMAAEQSRAAGGGRWVSGEVLAQNKGGFEFNGFNQRISSGTDGEGMQARYVVLDTDGSGSNLHCTHALEAPHTYGKYGGLKYLGKLIHFAGASPSSDSNCWFSPYVACSGGLDGVTLFFLFLFFCLLLGGAGSCFLHIRKHGQVGILGVFSGGGGSGSPTKIVLSLDDLVFINTTLSRRKLNEESMVKSQLDVKTPCHSVSGRSYIASTPDTSNVAVFEGDWVWLKKCPCGGSVSDISDSTQSIFIKLRDMRHENLNLFLGLFMDSGIFGIVTEHCTRGSLEDLLNNEEMRLDWMFKSSLLLDLIRGMKYLHNRGIIHGRLKSRNCVVDGRFVLKVTDYGFNEIIHSQNIIMEDNQPEDQLWTAPEMLRNPQLQKKGTYSADVYSFSIIMQEVISRCAPFCMLDMPPEEIIDKVRSPPPLCRPTVSLDEAPLEVIQIMKQAWSEEPDKRPTFEEIFRQFKNMNKGKKTNIIDSMLRMLEQYSSNLEDLIRERTEELEVERQKTDALLAQMLPKSVALALKTGKPVKPEHFSDVTLYFSDIVGFTTISALSEPIEVVDLLNDLYILFDGIIAIHDVYKVETIGDAYMVASGVPNRNGNRHAAEMANMSLDILHCIGTFQMRHMPDVKVKIRIGLHSGPVVAGVVGLKMPRYCLFGDTVNTASRMESTGLPYRIHVNQSTVDVLNSLKLGYKIATRGRTELKGKGVEETFWLVGRDGFDKPLPIPPDLTPGASNHGISLDEIPQDRRQKFLDRQKKMGN
ncbi:retinal guanylyl cyclase 1 isoform X1 [Xyrauchen texanus]|uniref:retinal guanylyl cyclase 1 isoform X1 n=2 Tax=Xyrauchen texanus TaxID=154827 RepID=UPI00224294EF|nr:retinal guanylyl cyclase 1 isoform X1 [Xyrauchen texanus]XP_051968455.1 retinal guanylyl cyclase 1 isoform X1 [Xyrauchen texanus]